jgi:hypothetical protein
VNEYPQDGTDCCNHDPEPGQAVTERCPECKHFYTRIDGELNCTWPYCSTQEILSGATEQTKKYVKGFEGFEFE